MFEPIANEILGENIKQFKTYDSVCGGDSFAETHCKRMADIFINIV